MPPHNKLNHIKGYVQDYLDEKDDELRLKSLKTYKKLKSYTQRQIEKSKTFISDVKTCKCLNAENNQTIQRLSNFRTASVKKVTPPLIDEETQTWLSMLDYSDQTEQGKFNFFTNVKKSQEKIHRSIKHHKKGGTKFSKKYKTQLKPIQNFKNINDKTLLSSTVKPKSSKDHKPKSSIDHKPKSSKDHKPKSSKGHKPKSSQDHKTKSSKDQKRKFSKNVKSKSFQKLKRKSSVNIEQKEYARQVFRKKPKVKTRPIFVKKQKKPSTNVKTNYMETLKKLFSSKHAKTTNTGKKGKSKSTEQIPSDKKKTFPKFKVKTKPKKKPRIFINNCHEKGTEDNNYKKHIKLKSTKKIKAKRKKTHLCKKVFTKP